MAARFVPTLLLLASPAILPATAAAQLYVRAGSGEEPGLGLGAALCSAGDLDGDGCADVVVGSDPSNTSHYGLVQFVSVRTGNVIRTLQSGFRDDGFGSSVASLGDVDLDGVDDVAVGAPTTRRLLNPARGVVRVYSGRLGQPLYTVPIDPTWSHTGLGRAVACAGDVDRDGVRDLIAGAIGSSGFSDGVAGVFSGRDGSLLHLLWPPTISHGFGVSVAGAGDVDRDNRPDVIVGAPFSFAFGSFSGAAYVFSGRDGTLIRTFPGTSGSHSGTVAPAGDLDQDLYADVAVGAPYAGSGAGSVTVYSGRTFAVLRTLTGTPGGARFGSSIAAEDLDGDGRLELLVGAPAPSDSGGGSGAVHLFSGHDGSRLAVISGWQSGEALGPAAAGGDVNADGWRDLVVGAPGWDGNGADVGAVRTFLLGHPAPRGECLPTFNSFGCGSSLVHDGVPSFSIGDPFVVTASYLVNRQPSWVLWGLEAANVPFGAGILCVRPRVTGPVLDSGGSAFPGIDCSGLLTCRFTPSYLAAHGVGPGQTVHCQFVSRDPHIQPPNDVMLSDALVFPIVP